MASIKLYNDEAFEVMRTIPDASIDMIFTDPPYSMTKNSWDKSIDLSRFWKESKRLIKNDGVIAIWTQPPFTYKIAIEAMDIFRYEWIVEKTRATGFLNSKKMPLKAHENVLVFYKKLPIYNPQKTFGHHPVHSYVKHSSNGSNYGKTVAGISGGGSTERYPRDVLKFSWDTRTSSIHPTQKPVTACEYFIKTYTVQGNIVLDPFMGSGSIAIASINCNRSFIGIEINSRFFFLAAKRCSQNEHISQNEIPMP